METSQVEVFFQEEEALWVYYVDENIDVDGAYLIHDSWWTLIYAKVALSGFPDLEGNPTSVSEDAANKFTKKLNYGGELFKP